jgi:hypothetical protein
MMRRKIWRLYLPVGHLSEHKKIRPEADFKGKNKPAKQRG